MIDERCVTHTAKNRQPNFALTSIQRTYPEGARNPILIGYRAALQQCRGPSPRRNNTTGNQARLYTATGCVEFLARLGRVLCIPILDCPSVMNLRLLSGLSGLPYLDVRNKRHEEREKESDSYNDAIANTLRENWRDGC